MSLEIILNEINQEKVVAEMDLNTISPRALPYKKGQVESAKSKLEGLYIDYKNEILKRAVFILVTGSDSNEFARIAEEDFKCFSVDGKSFFKDITEEISPQLYENKTINASVFDVVNNVLENKMKKLDVMSYNSLIFDTRYQRVVKNKSEMLDIVTQAVTDIIGGEVVGLDALEKVTFQAVNKNYKSGIAPILIHSEDEGFVTGLSDSLRKLNPRVVRVAAGKTKSDINALITLEKSSEEQVGKALKKIADNA